MALEAREAGEAEAAALLRSPEDLARLGELRLLYNTRLKVARTALGGLVAAQVEAAGQGLEKLERAQKGIAALRVSLGKIDSLCAECSALVPHHDKIRGVSVTHANTRKVLEDLEDIIDLPSRTNMVRDMLATGGSLLPAFEALCVLESTCRNARGVWQRSTHEDSEMRDLSMYLDAVSEVIGEMERILWEHIRNYDGLAAEDPVRLVDCLRIVELQELLDQEFVVRRADYTPKHFRQRCLDEIMHSVADKFRPTLDKCRLCGKPNKMVKYDQHGNQVLTVQHDYLGNMTSMKRLKRGVVEDVPEAQLAGVEVHEEEVFEEDEFMGDIVEELNGIAGDLILVYDTAAPCFPPDYNLFRQLCMWYHHNFAEAMDSLGRVGKELSNGSILSVLRWVQNYYDTLRNLGVEEESVRLPATRSSPDGVSGVERLVDMYVSRMEVTLGNWCKNLVEVDIRSEPRVNEDGTLYTIGVVDFFRIMNDEVLLLDRVSHGAPMYKAGLCSLRIMLRFQEEQRAALRRPDVTLEMAAAVLNNNVHCHDESLDFVEDLSRSLEDEYRDTLDAEDACRGFLDVAKAAAKRLADIIFADKGMAAVVGAMYSSSPQGSEWLDGRTTATLVATLADYFTDILTFVTSSWIKRVAETVAEVLVQRLLTIFITTQHQVTGRALFRMEADEKEINAFFLKYIKADKLLRVVRPLVPLRIMMSSTSVDAFVESYGAFLEAYAWPLPMLLDRLHVFRPDLSKKELTEIVARCRNMGAPTGTAASASHASLVGTGTVESALLNHEPAMSRFKSLFNKKK